ncbi:MGH1-like glycoside hydrolase domain-containing protein [Devosia rhizoryzae]|uniref:Mannosylglycerate hydrolase MGH1-like glycoside hydrolase domain-containing protein n=1 Tax=Devosia rhizoryzae TaxID=2774137 RepID=A0ABX7C4X6_9HYPH|nr:hypothetical protein [Devosia rhizoryzae]QQR38309.1 hypothetical protein JI748_11005 [Devosia rhizoryzae]
MMIVDDLLRTGRRGLRTRPGSLLLGPTGARLWAEMLHDAPGFTGAIDFIHKLNMPMLFGIAYDQPQAPLPSEVEWRPSHLTTRSRFGSLELEERRFVTWDDEAVSLQRWHNDGAAPTQIRLLTDDQWVTVGGEHATGERLIEPHQFTLRVQIGTSHPALWSGITLAPGETIEFVVAAAVGTSDEDTWPALTRKVERLVAQLSQSLLARQVADYQSWFDAVPHFTSSSPVLDRLYAYRWFLLRHNLAKPGRAPLDGTYFYEGRSHKMSKTAWKPEGWEFSKLIPLSTPMHLIEARWHHDAGLGTGVYPLLAEAQREDGQFDARTLSRVIHPYANFLGWGSYQYALAQGLSEVLREAIPMLKRQVLGEAEFLATGEDNLPIQQRHQLTGKEYQPSYWYFHDYPDDPLDQSTYTPLKRVDRAIYHHLNARGVAGLCRLAGDSEADRFDQLAEDIARDVLTKQWDGETGFFYDLHHQTDEKAMVRNVVGFYPYWAGLTGEEHLPGFLEALGPHHFDTPAPLPSVSPECPVFQSGGSWKGHFLKGRNGCMWDGPTWPYTNSVVIDGIGAVSRANGHQHDDLFAHFFWKYALLHFRNGDGETPYLVEHYDSMTGEPISDEPDYNHSYFVDLIIRQVVGIEIADNGDITVDPIDVGLEFFSLERLKVQNQMVEVSFSRQNGTSIRAV